MTTTTEKPIVGAIQALPHTPVYRMHRYFARRPHNVINALIRHYSRPGGVILDPFCGGGTTVVEGLRLKRKVIGVDINPMATLITRCEVIDIDPAELEIVLDQVIKATKASINMLYQTSCPQCGATATIDWTLWSVVYVCPHCYQQIVIAEAKKLGPGKYACTCCGETIQVTNLSRGSDRMLRQYVHCPACGFAGVKEATEEDIYLHAEMEYKAEAMIEREELWSPQQTMPVDYELRKPNNLVCQRFTEFFSRRNLLALARLLRAINNIENQKTRYFMQHVFTSVVGWTNRMVTDEHHGWALHAYWLPDIYCENNVWNILRRRGERAVRGKRYSQREIGDYFIEAESPDQLLRGNATCCLMTQSSTKLPLPDKSVDAVITDPPYGGNIQYGELCSFWAVWLPETMNLVGLSGNPEEVVKKRYKEGEDQRFENLLGQVFRECFRVLRDEGWLVITFNNRETSVWFSMLRAAREAGFYLMRDGVNYQPPVGDYARTLHQRKDGAIQGDFILSFQKGNAPAEQNNPMMRENTEVLVVALVADVLKNGPATFSEIYRQVIPVLVAHNALNEQVEELDLETMLSENFVFEEVSVEANTGWPLKKTTMRKWALPKT